MIDTAECLWCADLKANVKFVCNEEAGGRPVAGTDFHCRTTPESEAIDDHAAQQAE